MKIEQWDIERPKDYPANARRRPPANMPTVWNIDQKGDSDGIHPTQKPVELSRRPIAYHTDPNGIVYDPFGGSGTTLIAAEGLNRQCRTMELEPAFCDVIVTRWMNLTGKQATLEGSNATFEQVRDGRRLGERVAIKEEVLETLANK